MTRQYPQFLGLKSDPLKLRSKPAGYFSAPGKFVSSDPLAATLGSSGQSITLPDQAAAITLSAAACVGV